jgi:hypothetical protein
MAFNFPRILLGLSAIGAAVLFVAWAWKVFQPILGF